MVRLARDRPALPAAWTGFKPRPNQNRRSDVYRGMGVAQQVGSASRGSSEKDDFTALIRPYWSDMSRFAERLVGDDAADDVLQEALANAWRGRRKVDPGFGSPRSWLLAIVANEARDFWRAKQRRHRNQVLLEESTVIFDRQDDAVLSLDITAALQRLSHRQRAAVSLHYYLGVSVNECAVVLGCAPGTVKSTLSDARRTIKELLGEKYR